MFMVTEAPLYRKGRYEAGRCGDDAMSLFFLMPVDKTSQTSYFNVCNEGVAQLVSATACHAVGRGFDPRHSRS